MKKILEVCDRPGWAVDRLSKPISELYDNVDMSYFYGKKMDRFLNTGYSPKEGNTQYTPELANQYDIVHFHKVKASNISVGMLGPSVRKIVSIHNERCFDEADWSLYDDVICPTQYTYEEMTKRHKRVHYVPYGIDLKKYYYQFRKPNERTVGYVGRIASHKRFNRIANAIGKVKYNLIACGYVDDSKILQGLDRNVKYFSLLKITTLLPEVQMNNFYSLMGLYINASEAYTETGPLPVMEAMACGIPVISTEGGWAKDWCQHENNIWFVKDEVVENADKFGKTIQNVYERVDIRNKIKDNALHLIKDFSVENYAKKVMDIYEST